MRGELEKHFGSHEDVILIFKTILYVTMLKQVAVFHHCGL